MTTPLLSVSDLAFSYAEGPVALDGVSLELAPGEALGIVGANGAGKSTLLLLLAGVLSPSRGRFTLDGMERLLPFPSTVRRRLGVVFQDPDDQLFLPTVYDDVAFGPRHRGLSPQKVREAALSALERVGASHLASRMPHALSGGEKRLAALAAALAPAPEVLLLDEPSAALDPRARRKLVELLRTLPEARVVASHDLDLVLDVCPRVILLREGRLFAQGATAELLEDEALLDAAGLELPLSRSRQPVSYPTIRRGA